MREIKFRAWDKKEKKMREVRDLHWDAEGGLDVEYGCQPIDEACHGSDTLMQYTGLKDKDGKGKEVYSGDVAKDKHGQIFEIIADYKFLAHLEDIWFEVIGNIYENPELNK